MSDKGDKNEKIETIEKERVIIDVKRSNAEKELTEELGKKQAEIQKKEDEKQQVIKDLETRNAKIKEFEDAQETKTQEYETVTADRDKLKNQLAEIATAEFTKQKAEMINKVKAAGFYTEEQIKEMEEKIKQPADLQRTDMIFNWVGTNMQKAIEDRVTAKIKEVQDATEKKDKEGTTVDNPPKGSLINVNPPKVQSEGVYNSYMEMVDDIYSKAATGTPEEAKKAELQKKQLWDKAAKKLKSDLEKVSIIECPRCTAGILEGTVCPGCGWDPAKNKNLELYPNILTR